MNTIKAKVNQSSLDVILMACGSLEGAMQIMAANDTSITVNPPVNTEYTIPDSVTGDTGTLSYLQQNSVVIGTYSFPL